MNAVSTVEAAAAVPYIQKSDINDGDILNQTRKMANGTGHIVLEYPLPNGEPFRSDPIHPDSFKSGLMLQWVDAVKQRLVDDAQAAQDAGMRKTRGNILEGPGVLDQYIPDTVPSEAQLRAAGVPALRAPPPAEPVQEPSELVSDSPKAFAKRRVSELKASEKLLEKGIKDRQKALKEVQAALAEWQGVVVGLTKKRK